MKLYAIRDDSMSPQSVIGYLAHYEKSNTFVIELAPDLSAEDAPLFFSSFIKKETRTLDPQWSLCWVRQRIVPTDRQNLGMILRSNHLREYDEMKLLLLGHGRCAQDDCSIAPVTDSSLPFWMLQRHSRRLKMILPIRNFRMLAAYRDDSVIICNLSEFIHTERRYQILARDPERYEKAVITPGGSGLTWGSGLFLSAEELKSYGTALSLTLSDLLQFSDSTLLDTAQVCDMLGCTRQYVDSLVRQGKLQVIKQTGKARFYLKSDVEELKW